MRDCQRDRDKHEEENNSLMYGIIFLKKIQGGFYDLNIAKDLKHMRN